MNVLFVMWFICLTFWPKPLMRDKNCCYELSHYIWHIDLLIVLQTFSYMKVVVDPLTFYVKIILLTQINLLRIKFSQYLWQRDSLVNIWCQRILNVLFLATKKYTLLVYWKWFYYNVTDFHSVLNKESLK